MDPDNKHRKILAALITLRMYAVEVPLSVSNEALDHQQLHYRVNGGLFQILSERTDRIFHQAQLQKHMTTGSNHPLYVGFVSDLIQIERFYY